MGITAVALRDLHDGDEVLISYLDFSKDVSLKSRRRQLLANYGFNCQCTRCEYESLQLKSVPSQRADRTLLLGRVASLGKFVFPTVSQLHAYLERSGRGMTPVFLEAAAKRIVDESEYIRKLSCCQ